MAGSVCLKFLLALSIASIEFSVADTRGHVRPLSEQDDADLPLGKTKNTPMYTNVLG